MSGPYCQTEQDFIEYGKQLFREQEEARKNGFLLLNLFEERKSPISLQVEGEQDYRRGFVHGFSYAVEVIGRLQSKGYCRASEIANIMNDFECYTLMPWRYSAARDIHSDKKRWGHPFLKTHSWPEIRKKVFERDGFKCVQCGGRQHIQCDHVTPVSSGGLPVKTNLQTLCKRCNQEKGSR